MMELEFYTIWDGQIKILKCDDYYLFIFLHVIKLLYLTSIPFNALATIICQVLIFYIFYFKL